MSQITDFNEKLKKLVNNAKSYENLKNYRKSIKVWIEISEFCLKFSKNPKLDVTFKNMLLMKIRNIINHVKSLRLKIAEISSELEEQRITSLISDLPEPPSSEPEPLDSSVDVGSIEEEIITSDQKVKFTEEDKEIPNGFKEIETQEYDFKTIIPKNRKSTEIKKPESTVHKQIDSTKIQGTNSEKSSYIKETKLKKTTRACPFCGGGIEIDENICSHCGTPLSNR